MATPARDKHFDFAPYGETLGVSADSVLSVQADENGRRFVVLYTETPTRAPDAMLFRAVIWRDDQGILQVIEDRRLCTLGRFAAQVKLIMGGIFEPLPPTPAASFEGFDFDTGWLDQEQ